jgi:hypothetical protein
LLWTMSSRDLEEAGIEMAWTKSFFMLMILIWWGRTLSITGNKANILLQVRKELVWLHIWRQTKTKINIIIILLLCIKSITADCFSKDSQDWNFLKFGVT